MNQNLSLIYTFENNLSLYHISLFISHVSSTAKLFLPFTLSWINRSKEYLHYIMVKHRDMSGVLCYLFFLFKKKEREKKAKLSNIYVKKIKKNKSGIVYIVYVGVAQAWYPGAAMDCELLDHEFSSSY